MTYESWCARPPAGAFTCTWTVGGAGNCDPTEQATWTLGDLAAGEGRTLRLAPALAAAATSVDLPITLLENGAQVFEEPPRLQVAVAASRRLELRLAEEADPARPGATLRYALRYGHPVVSDFTNGVVARYNQLSEAVKRDLLNFLRSL